MLRTNLKRKSKSNKSSKVLTTGIITTTTLATAAAATVHATTEPMTTFAANAVTVTPANASTSVTSIAVGTAYQQNLTSIN